MTERPFSASAFRDGFIAGRTLPDFAALAPGNRVVLALPCGRKAVMDHPDFARIRADHGGAFPRPYWNDNGGGLGYVRFHDPGRQAHRGNNGMLARLVAGPVPAGRRVTYRNGNRLDLTRGNLAVSQPKPRKAGG